MPVLLRRPTPEQLDQRLAQALASGLSYDEVGATRQGGTRGRLPLDEYSVDLGRGQDVFDRATAALRRWVGEKTVSGVYDQQACAFGGRTGELTIWASVRGFARTEARVSVWHLRK